MDDVARTYGASSSSSHIPARSGGSGRRQLRQPARDPAAVACRDPARSVLAAGRSASAAGAQVTIIYELLASTNCSAVTITLVPWPSRGAGCDSGGLVLVIDAPANGDRCGARAARARGAHRRPPSASESRSPAARQSRSETRCAVTRIWTHPTPPQPQEMITSSPCIGSYVVTRRHEARDFRSAPEKSLVVLARNGAGRWMVNAAQAGVLGSIRMRGDR